MHGVEFVVSVNQLGADELHRRQDKSSIHVGTHINDCVYDGGVLLYASWDEVVTIDVKTRHRETKTRVRRGCPMRDRWSWDAWLVTQKIFAQRR